jgi:hypothetical protein
MRRLRIMRDGIKHASREQEKPVRRGADNGNSGMMSWRGDAAECSSDFREIAIDDIEENS